MQFSKKQFTARGGDALTPMIPGTCLSQATEAEREEFLALGINYCHAVGLALQNGFYWLQPPVVMSAGGNQGYISYPEQFYVGRAH